MEHPPKESFHTGHFPAKKTQLFAVVNQTPTERVIPQIILAVSRPN